MADKRQTRIFAAAGHWTTKTGERFQGGLFRTSRGDGQWRSLTAGLPENVEARALAVHPREPDVIYAGTQDGPYRSTDGGEHWERLDFPERGAVVWSLAFHPTRPKSCTRASRRWRSIAAKTAATAGRSSRARNRPSTATWDFPTRTTRIAVDPGRPDDVYAALEVSGVIRSTDGGETWTDLSAPLIKLAEQPHLKSRIGSDTRRGRHARFACASRSAAARHGVSRGAHGTFPERRPRRVVARHGDRPLFAADLLPRRHRLAA